MYQHKAPIQDKTHVLRMQQFALSQRILIIGFVVALVQAGGGAKSGTETGRGSEGVAALQEEGTVERLRERDTEIWMSKMHHDGAVE